MPTRLSSYVSSGFSPTTSGGPFGIPGMVGGGLAGAARSLPPSSDAPTQTTNANRLRSRIIAPSSEIQRQPQRAFELLVVLVGELSGERLVDRIGAGEHADGDRDAPAQPQTESQR